MGLYKRQGKEGATWSIQYFAHGKRIREAIGPSKRQAELVLAKRKADIREGRFFESTRHSVVTLSVLLDKYLSEHSTNRHKPRSLERYIQAAKPLKEYFGTRLIRDITPDVANDYVLHRQSQGKTNATINVELALLSSALAFAVKMKLLTKSPVKGELGLLKANKKERYLSQEEIGQLLEHCNGDFKDMVVVALGTGMRASEVLSLARETVDLNRRTVVLLDTKNGERRVVTLPPNVVEILRQRPLPLRHYFAGWPLQRLEDSFRRVVKRAGLPGVTFHTLRHTFASHAVMAGIDLYTLAGLLGHKTLNMVQRYAHLAPDYLKSATDRAAAAVFAGNVPQEVPQTKQEVA